MQPEGVEGFFSCSTAQEVVLTFESVDDMKIVKYMAIQMKATEQYFHMVLFIMLYKEVLAFKFVDEILKCDHSNESY